MHLINLVMRDPQWLKYLSMLFHISIHKLWRHIMQQEKSITITTISSKQQYYTRRHSGCPYWIHAYSHILAHIKGCLNSFKWFVCLLIKGFFVTHICHQSVFIWYIEVISNPAWVTITFCQFSPIQLGLQLFFVSFCRDILYVANSSVHHMGDLHSAAWQTLIAVTVSLD